MAKRAVAASSTARHRGHVDGIAQALVLRATCPETHAVLLGKDYVHGQRSTRVLSWMAEVARVEHDP